MFLVQKYSDSQVNLLLAACASTGVATLETFRAKAKSLRSKKVLGLKATASKKEVIRAHRVAMATFTDRKLRELEAYLDDYTAAQLAAHFENEPMPAPAFDVNWLEVIAKPGAAKETFGANGLDGEDVARAKLLVAPILKGIHNVAAQSGTKLMVPIKR